MANSADTDHLASLKPNDLDLYCLQSRVYQGSGTKVKGQIFETPVQKITIFVFN